MAMFPSEVKKEIIHQIVECEKFKLFHENMKKELGIEDIKYNLILENRARDENGYGDNSPNARIKINKDWKSVDQLILFEEGLISSINSKFSKMSGLHFDRVVEICIKFAIVHELVHIQQFKNGILTKEKLSSLKEIPYKDRDSEIEANTIAEDIIGRESEFDKKIISILITNTTLNNDEMQECLELYDL